jgi:hypothetical protein
MEIGILCKIKSFFWHTKVVLFVVFLMFFGCTTSKHPKTNELPEIEIDYVRFESLFYGDLDTPLQKIKNTFPYFFPTQTPDNVWMKKRTDSLQQALFQATQPLFKNELKLRTENVFKHVKFYFPNEPLPKKVITLLTDVDYSLRAVDADSLLLISIDTYLGSNHPLYEGIPKHIREKLMPNHLEAEIIDALSPRFVPRAENRTFLAHCIAHGKRLLLHEYFAPDILQNQYIQYTQEQWDWAAEHEETIWRYFVDNELLFSTDENLRFRFLMPGPYSKFYTTLDVNSPGRIGQWVGYRIVKAYQERSGASLHQVLTIDAQELLKKSKYNP